MRIEKPTKSQNTMNEDIYIIGAGGHGQVVADAILKEGFSVRGFFDDGIPAGKIVEGIPVLGEIALAKKISGKFVIAIGDNKIRKDIASFLNFPDEKYFTVIHPSAVIGKGVEIGAGSMIIGGVVINVCSVIGRHTIINTSASIDHHSLIRDFVHFAPGSHTGGNVVVEEGVFVGLGSSLIHNVKIGKWAVIGAGAVVINNISPYSVSVGVPARIIRRLK